MRRSMGLALVLGLLVLLGLAAGGCGRSEAVASVNRERITSDELDKRIAFFEFAYAHRLRGKEYREARGQVLDMLLDEEIVIQEARKRRLVAKPKDIQAEQKRLTEYIKKQVFGGKDKQFQKAMKEAGVTNEDIRKYVERQMAGDMLFRYVTRNVKVTNEEVRQLYEANKKRFQEPDQVKLWELRTDDPTKAEKALTELRGGADFASVARKYSTDPLAQKNGGLHGYVPKGGGVIKEVEDVAFKLKPGELSGIVQSHYALHVLKVDDVKKGKALAFDEVKEGLRQQVMQTRQQQVFEDYREKLKRRARVTREE